LNSVDGVCKRNSRLTTKACIDNQFSPKDIAVNFQQHFQTILSATKRPPFFAELVSMRVTWIATTTDPVSEITAMQCILSEATSNNKQTSGNKRALPLIGSYLKQFIRSAPCVSGRRRPDTKKHLIPSMKMLKGVEVDKALKAAQHDEQRAFPFFDFLFSDTYEAYYANPRDSDIA